MTFTSHSGQFFTRQVYIQAGMMELPKRVSFMSDVYPILQRLTGLQWVNKGLQAYFGAGAQMNFENEDFVKRIAMAPDPGYLAWPLGRLPFVLHPTPISPSST